MAVGTTCGMHKKKVRGRKAEKLYRESMKGCGRAAGAVARWSKEHVRKAKERIWRYFALKQCFLAFIVGAPVDPDHGQAGFRPSRGATAFADREALIDVLADLQQEPGISPETNLVVGGSWHTTTMGKIVFSELK